MAAAGLCPQSTRHSLFPHPHPHYPMCMPAVPQGAQLMAKFGINVPEGVPAYSVADVEKAAPLMADENGEVSRSCGGERCKCV